MKAFGMAVLLGAVSAALAQDTRHVTEPVFPATCITLPSQLAIVKGEPSSETEFDSERIKNALRTRRAVE